MILVEVYSKHDCHLCDQAKGVLRDLQRRHPFELREIIIQEGDEYFASYSERVPVITINQEFAFQYRVPVGEFMAKLRSLSSQHR